MGFRIMFSDNHSEKPSYNLRKNLESNLSTHCTVTSWHKNLHNNIYQYKRLVFLSHYSDKIIALSSSFVSV